MIDIEELRRLAQAATPHVGHACKYLDAHWLREGHVDFENADLFIASERPQEDAAFFAAANPTTVIELLDRLEAAEKERESWKGLAQQFGNELDTLRAKIAEMEQQEPVGVLHVGSCYGEELEDWEFEANQQACDRLNERYGNSPTALKLYALPGAKGEEK